MGIGDRLLAKTANIGSKPTEAAQPRPVSTEPRTSPGRLMDAQNRINSAQSRIKEIAMAKKVAYVTGGMGGIGTAICQRL